MPLKYRCGSTSPAILPHSSESSSDELSSLSISSLCSSRSTLHHQVNDIHEGVNDCKLYETLLGSSRLL